MVSTLRPVSGATMCSLFDLGLLFKRAAAMMVVIAIIVILVSPLLASPPTVLRLNRAAESAFLQVLLAFVSLVGTCIDGARPLRAVARQGSGRIDSSSSSPTLHNCPLLC